jgi:hypothetical protein
MLDSDKYHQCEAMVVDPYYVRFYKRRCSRRAYVREPDGQLRCWQHKTWAAKPFRGNGSAWDVEQDKLDSSL